jgi:hypothetical protein
MHPYCHFAAAQSMLLLALLSQARMLPQPRSSRRCPALLSQQPLQHLTTLQMAASPQQQQQQQQQRSRTRQRTSKVRACVRCF